MFDAVIPDRDPRSEPAAAEEVAEPTPEVLGFGEYWHYNDGVSVTVGKAFRLRPGAATNGVTGSGTVLVMPVSILNDTANTLDPVLTRVSASSGGLEASRVTDYRSDIGAPPNTPVLPGESITWAVAFEVADPSDFLVAVGPSIDHDTALFRGGETTS